MQNHLEITSKLNLGTKKCEIRNMDMSEHGHVHHVPKAPSEGETLQKNSKHLFTCSVNKMISIIKVRFEGEILQQ